MSATYPERYAEALGLAMGAAEAESVLDLARVVAHASERKYAPLSSYLAGQFVAGRVRAGVPHTEALAEAAAIAEAVLGGEA
ncbi:MAG: DUF6457 domain-containing protein [Actinomycetota bacterium]|nr:DUF6457 domain-containing protein [Actinomycetota bacterium]